MGGHIHGDLVHLSDADQAALLRLARAAICAHIDRQPRPQFTADDLTAGLAQRVACFVTLTEGGDLRGCIGQCVPSGPLWEAVAEAAVSAATRDPRFPQVCAGEVERLRISVSVLTPTLPLGHRSTRELLAMLQPGVHGVVLRHAGRVGLYLPQVWDHFTSPATQIEDFLISLSRKAGDPSGRMWSASETVIEVFETLSFGEP